MMSDLVNRLRIPLDSDDPDLWIADRERREAADRIKALEGVLRLARLMIRDETIEHAVIDTQSMQSLGAAIDAALAPEQNK